MADRLDEVLNRPLPDTGRLPLEEAISRGFYEGTRMLLERGARLDVQASDGRPVLLHLATSPLRTLLEEHPERVPATHEALSILIEARLPRVALHLVRRGVVPDYRQACMLINMLSGEDWTFGLERVITVDHLDLQGDVLTVQINRDPRKVEIPGIVDLTVETGPALIDDRTLLMALIPGVPVRLRGRDVQRVRYLLSGLYPQAKQSTKITDDERKLML